MEQSGLVLAYLLDGEGGGRQLDWDAINRHRVGTDLIWIHLHRTSADSQAWLNEQSGLDPLVVESLLAESTRPHCAEIGQGVMLFLRGVNLNPGAKPDDMVSIRIWVEKSRIISVRMRKLQSIEEMCRALAAGTGPVDEGDFIVKLADFLTTRMSGFITNMDEEVDDLQEQMLETESRQLRNELTRLRRGIIAFRRYLTPQRDALLRFTQLKLTWLSDIDILHLREEVDRITRYIEDLDAARERAAVTQEELNNKLSEQMNSRMYVLSVVAALFLPLGFLTGLLGVNVGGIPLADNPWGFLLVTLALGVITALLIVFFRWRDWL